MMREELWAFGRKLIEEWRSTERLHRWRSVVYSFTLKYIRLFLLFKLSWVQMLSQKLTPMEKLREFEGEELRIIFFAELMNS